VVYVASSVASVIQLWSTTKWLASFITVLKKCSPKVQWNDVLHLRVRQRWMKGDFIWKTSYYACSRHQLTSSRRVAEGCSSYWKPLLIASYIGVIQNSATPNDQRGYMRIPPTNDKLYITGGLLKGALEMLWGTTNLENLHIRSTSMSKQVVRQAIAAFGHRNETWHFTNRPNWIWHIHFTCTAQVSHFSQPKLLQ